MSVKVSKRDLKRFAERMSAEKVAVNVYEYENKVHELRSKKDAEGNYIYKGITYLYYSAGMYGNSGQLHQAIDNKGNVTYIYYV